MPVPGMTEAPSRRVRLDVERLDAYQVALEFLGRATEMGRGKLTGVLRDQLDRASSSSLAHRQPVRPQ